MRYSFLSVDTKDAATYYPDAFGCICYSLLHNKLAQTWQLKTTPTFFFLKKERKKKKNPPSQSSKVRNPGWPGWIIYSESHKAEIKVLVVVSYVELRVTFKPIPVIGKFQFLAAVGLKSLFSCWLWLLAGDSCGYIGATQVLAPVATSV